MKKLNILCQLLLLFLFPSISSCFQRRFFVLYSWLEKLKMACWICFKCILIISSPYEHFHKHKETKIGYTIIDNYLRVQSGTLSGYTTPIFSNPKFPSQLARYPANATIILPNGGLESKKNVFLRYCPAYLP